MTLDLKPIVHPTFELTIPSTSKKVSSRPIVTRERKALLTALESGETSGINRVVKDIVGACVKNVVVDELTTFDFEWIFLQLIINSIKETIDLEVRIPDRDEECGECGKVRLLKVNLRDAKIEGIATSKKDFLVEVSDGLSLKLKYPSEHDLVILQDIAKDKNELEQLTDLISICIDSVFDESGTKKFNQFDYKTKIDFLDSLPIPVTDKLERFIKAIPKLSLRLVIECPKCKFKAFHEMSGLSDFFV